MANDSQHLSVMTQEVIESLQIRANTWYVDATFGRGGHTAAIIKAGGKVIAFDVDQEAVEYGQAHFAAEIAAGQLILLRSNFNQLLNQVRQTGVMQIEAILFDFGTSSNQLMSDDRGFSFSSQAPLDMRMDQRLGVTALDLLNVLPENQLVTLFQEMGGEHEAKSIARAIKRKQVMQQGLLKINAHELADLIASVKRERHSKLHPATKTFQALRIAVNQELDSISQALPQALELVPTGGRIVTISFHEGEDRIAKHTFRTWKQAGKGQEITKHIMEPSADELARNPRARSAKMRVFEVI